MRFPTARLVCLGVLAASAGCTPPPPPPAPVITPTPDSPATPVVIPAAPKIPAVWAQLVAQDIVPSQMPPGHAERFRRLALEQLPKELRPAPEDIIPCSFVLATTEPTNPAKDSTLFLFATEPAAMPALLEKWGITGDMRDALKAMADSRAAILMSPERLKAFNLRVGDRFKPHGLNYPGMVFEFEIVGELRGENPQHGAIMNLAYLDALLKKLDDPQLKARSLNMVLVRLPSQPAFERLATLVDDPKEFPPPLVKLTLVPDEKK